MPRLHFEDREVLGIARSHARNSRDTMGGKTDVWVSRVAARSCVTCRDHDCKSHFRVRFAGCR